jgi:hypothetical protein
MKEWRVDEDEDLPLHDEAEAREKWRGAERIAAHGGEGLELPTSVAEPDDAGDANNAERPAERLPPD